MQVHLYLMCYQSEALVASHLDAEAFGRYMAIGTRKHTSGNVIFFEIDGGTRSDFLNLPAAAESCVAHSDGSPRHSTYISIYRVMEHLPFEAFRKLYLVTRDGRVLGLDAAPYTALPGEDKRARLYTELCPVTPRVVTQLSPVEFSAFITDPAQPVHVPRIFFADSLIECEEDGSLAGYLPYANPEHIVDCVRDIETRKAKMTKTVDRNPPLVAFYRTIGRGFFLGDRTGVKFYPFPTRDALDEEHHLWWRSASLD